MSLVCDCSSGETIGNLQRGLGFKYLLLHWDVVCAALPYGGLVIQKLIFNQVFSWKWLRRYVSMDRIWGSGEGKMLMSVSRFDILGSFLFSFLAVGVGKFFTRGSSYFQIHRSFVVLAGNGTKYFSFIFGRWRRGWTSFDMGDVMTTSK